MRLDCGGTISAQEASSKTLGKRGNALGEGKEKAARPGENRRNRGPGERWAFGGPALLGWGGLRAKGWRAARRTR
jgi:hypothetical protein